MIFQLLTPAISMTFAFCFLAIHLYDKSKKAPAILAIAYTCGSASLIIDYFRLSLDPANAAIATNILYTATLFLTTISIAVHYRTKAPLLLMSVIAVMEASLLIYYIYWQPDITIRTIIANATAAGLLASSFLVMTPNSKMMIDRLFYWVVCATAAQFFLRSIFVGYMAFYQGYMLTDANYSQSIITISLHFSIAIFSLILAVTACVAFGLDAISDIKKLADTDTLSGLLNRRGFEIEAYEIIASAQDTKVPVAMIVADLDKFKLVNDNYGHIIGDDVIREFGKLLQTLCRDNDITGRIGGEEFCILLRAADINLGRLSAEMIRKTLEEKVFKAGEKTFSITASFGVAELREHENFNTLYARADEELYISKNSGRNQVRPKRMNYILKSVI